MAPPKMPPPKPAPPAAAPPKPAPAPVAAKGGSFRWTKDEVDALVTVVESGKTGAALLEDFRTLVPGHARTKAGIAMKLWSLYPDRRLLSAFTEDGTPGRPRGGYDKPRKARPAAKPAAPASVPAPSSITLRSDNDKVDYLVTFADSRYAVFFSRDEAAQAMASEPGARLWRSVRSKTVVVFEE